MKTTCLSTYVSRKMGCPFIKLTMVSHAINEFEFQQVILTSQFNRKKSLYLYNNTTRWIRCYVEYEALYSAQWRMSAVYRNETSAFYNDNTRRICCYVEKEIPHTSAGLYIASPNHRLVCTFQPAVCRCICINIYLSAPLMYNATIVQYINNNTYM